MPGKVTSGDESSCTPPPHQVGQTTLEGREMLASLADRLGKLGLAKWKTRR